MWSAVEPGGSGGSGGSPCSRAKHSATLLGGHVYVLGGRGAGGSLPLKDFWKYSIAEGTWQRLTSRGEAPPSLQEHSAVARGHCLYVFGGEAGAISNETPLWIYNTQSGLWRKLPGVKAPTPRRGSAVRPESACAPRGRRGHTAHALSDCMLVYGGYKDMHGSTNELWAFHFQSEVWQLVRSGAGPRRHGHAAVLHGATLYLHAGCQDLKAQADVWTFDTQCRRWSPVRSARVTPPARWGHTGVRAGGWWYIFGGAVRGQPVNDLWRFHFAEEWWERVLPGTCSPSPRVDARALLVAGGTGTAPSPLASRPAPPRSRSRPARTRGPYCALAGEDSPALPKSRSAYIIDNRELSDEDPPSGEEAEYSLSREPLSVPDLAELAVPDLAELELPRTAQLLYIEDSIKYKVQETDSETSTSAYESEDGVHRLAFSNPHYLGPDVRRLGSARSPDSGLELGLGPGLELRELGPARPAPRLHVLLVGGREQPHAALLTSPSVLSMWTYRLL